jgi:hypothetical protein
MGTFFPGIVRLGRHPSCETEAEATGRDRACIHHKQCPLVGPSRSLVGLHGRNQEEAIN